MSDDRTELRRIVLRLSLMSHAPAQAYNVAPSDARNQSWRISAEHAPLIPLAARAKAAESRAPAGGVDVRGDLTPEYRQKSHIYFERRLRRVRTAGELSALLEEAREALRDWMKTPAVAGVELERGSFAWKCQVADDDSGTEQQRVDRYSISRATLYRYRAKYRGLQVVLSERPL